MEGTSTWISEIAMLQELAKCGHDETEPALIALRDMARAMSSIADFQRCVNIGLDPDRRMRQGGKDELIHSCWLCERALHVFFAKYGITYEVNKRELASIKKSYNKIMNKQREDTHED